MGLARRLTLLLLGPGLMLSFATPEDMRPDMAAAVGRVQLRTIAGAALSLVSPGRAESRCWAGKDLVVQALERVQANSSTDKLIDANELLKRAADLCGDSGDAWYYRSLVEAKLGHGRLADYALKQAQLFPSEALTDGVNPFVLATPGAKPNQPLPPVRQRWALVVGIGNFKDQNIDPLKYTVGDAKAFRDVLVDPKLGGFKSENVRLLVNDEAKLANIKKGINWLARSAQPDDLAVVYVASHGSPRGLDTGGASYIITHDTELGEQIDPDALYATAFPMVELSNAVATRVKALRTAVFLDTCHSGGAIEGGKTGAAKVANASISKATLDHIRQGTGRIIFAASEKDQSSWESDALQHGYFTYYLVKALRAHPGMPLSSIFAEVQDGVSSQVAVDYKMFGTQQTPVLSQSASDTDFSLGAGEVKAARVGGGGR